jgi:hypothetical protein
LSNVCGRVCRYRVSRAASSAFVPAASGVELSNQIEQASGRRFEMHRQLGNLVAQAIEFEIRAGGIERGSDVAVHRTSPSRARVKAAM